MTIAELQKELTDTASLIFFVSSTLEEESSYSKPRNSGDDLGTLQDEDDGLDWDDEEGTWEEDRELDGHGAAELLELLGLSYMDLAASLTGDGSRGPYFQFPKPTDFFQCCLLAPDRIFRSVFRCVSYAVHILSLIFLGLL